MLNVFVLEANVRILKSLMDEKSELYPERMAYYTAFTLFETVHKFDEIFLPFLIFIVAWTLSE